MKRLFTILVLLVSCIIINAQVPQGFNYQAIVRNSSGSILQNKTLKVTITIKTALTGGSVIWEEYHNVTSDQFGSVSFAVGTGNHVSGTVPSFDRIDWKATPLYLRTTVEYPAGTTTDMGTSQILSVPYSLVARDVQGPIGKLDIKETETSLPDSAIFEVKNKKGQTIFAVYNEGVRIYVDDGSKGKKGGFAVGGFDMSKATKREYLVVTDDSIRMYIDNNLATKAKKGGFAVGGYDMSKGTAQNFLDLTPENYFIGHQAGVSNTTGVYNSFIGFQSGYSNTIGFNNTLLGYYSGYSNVSGIYNTYLGNASGKNSISDSANTFVGTNAGMNFTRGSFNTFIGSAAGEGFKTGGYNVFIGSLAGSSGDFTGITRGGQNNVAIGTVAGFRLNTGISNVFVGNAAGVFNTSGSYNVFVGLQSGWNNSTGNFNSYIGNGAGHANTNGNGNVMLGYWSGVNLNSGNSNIFIGTNSGGGLTSASNKLFIENSAADQNNALIYGDFNTDYLQLNANVYVRNNLYVQGGVSATDYYYNSDNRLKTEIREMGIVMPAILKIRPVFYSWNSDSFPGRNFDKERQIGFIAQDIESFFPEIVRTDEEGFKSVDYGKMTVVLLQALKEQQYTLESYKSENDNLRSQLYILQEKIKQIETLITKSDMNQF